MNAARANWHEFESRFQLADALAEAVASNLRGALSQRGNAVLAVSGGRTPDAFFSSLSHLQLDWERVTVTLADERFVPIDHPRSNEKMVRERLLQNRAATANLIGLASGECDIQEAARNAWLRLTEHARSMDAVVLGMGLDGHFASIFPDAENLEELTASRFSAAILPVRAASAGEPRLSMTLAWILRSSHIYLHVEGQEKRELLRSCLTGALDAPIARLFAQATNPVEIYWAPPGEES